MSAVKRHCHGGGDAKNNDGDDYFPEESIKQDELTSRRRRDDLFSDYTIVITVKKPRDEEEDDTRDDDDNERASGKEESIYHVRKAILAHGLRRSDYFARLFRHGNFSAVKSKKDKTSSRIELNALQAKAFPDLLDYMYGQKASFTTNTATALYTLAKCFDVQGLEHEVMQFCWKDMETVETCGTYYHHATILQEDCILQPAAKFCRDNIAKINPTTSGLLKVPDPQFWLDLLQDHAANGTITTDLGEDLCLHLAVYCHDHAAFLSPEMFKKLTDEEYLVDDYLQPACALILLDAERHIVGNDNATTSRPQLQQQQGGEGEEGESNELSSLQMRCVNALARGNHEPKAGSYQLYDHWIRDALRQLSPLVLAEIITRGGLLLPRRQQKSSSS
jgi:BTB/POZ domain